MNCRLYRYVGPEGIRRRALVPPDRTCVRRIDDLRGWVSAKRMKQGRGATLAATYVVDPEKRLWIADRASEHIACAGGEAVFAAGELVFAFENERIAVSEVNNLSTGFCPQPDSWAVLASVLDDLGLSHPGRFTDVFDFRRCASCGTTNVIKDQVFECAVCGSTLCREWNYG